MTEQILAQFKGVNILNVTVRGTAASRQRVEGFSGWQRQCLRLLIAVQINCERLLLVDDAIAVRKTIERQKRSWAQHS